RGAGLCLPDVVQFNAIQTKIDPFLEFHFSWSSLNSTTSAGSTSNVLHTRPKVFALTFLPYSTFLTVDSGICAVSASVLNVMHFLAIANCKTFRFAFNGSASFLCLDQFWSCMQYNGPFIICQVQNQNFFGLDE